LEERTDKEASESLKAASKEISNSRNNNGGENEICYREDGDGDGDKGGAKGNEDGGEQNNQDSVREGRGIAVRNRNGEAGGNYEISKHSNK